MNVALSLSVTAHLAPQAHTAVDRWEHLSACVPAFDHLSRLPGFPTAAKWGKLIFIAVFQGLCFPALLHLEEISILEEWLSCSSFWFDLPRSGDLVSRTHICLLWGCCQRRESAIPAMYLQWSDFAGGKHSWIGKLPECIQEESSQSGDEGNSFSPEHFTACYGLDSSGKVQNQ